MHFSNILYNNAKVWMSRQYFSLNRSAQCYHQTQILIFKYIYIYYSTVCYTKTIFFVYTNLFEFNSFLPSKICQDDSHENV